MKTKARLIMLWYGSSVLLVALVGVWEILVLNLLQPEARQQISALLTPYQYWLAGPIFLLLALVVFGTKWLLEQFWMPLAQLREEAEVLASGNASRRLEPQGASTVQNLAKQINRLAEQTEAARHEVQTQIGQAKQAVERERNVMAVLIEELREGVIVCNRNGLVLLYNRSARSMLNPDSAPQNTSLLGLGKNIRDTLKAPLLEYTLQDLQERQQLGNAGLVQPFMLWQGANLLRIQLLGMLGQDHQFNGFILVCEDQTPRPQTHPLNLLEQETLEQRRTAIANIRATVETILDYPDMAVAQQQALLDLVQQQAVKLTELLEDRKLASSKELQHLCPLSTTSMHDWLTDLYRHGEPDSPYLLRYHDEGTVDQYANLNRFLLNKALRFLFERLQEELQLRTFDLRRAPFRSGQGTHQGEFAVVDLSWEGPMLSTEHLRAWLEHPLQTEAAESTITLLEIFQQHDIEAWFEENNDTGQHYLRLLFPATAAPPQGATSHIYLGSRPIFYDFDLFEKTGTDPELVHTRLSDVRYTIFDTETTGLDPSGGDEIISIGAIHIVNGKLLEHETFEQLINPQREISEASIEIHGIHPEQLVNKPTILQVLPRFQHFVEHTVLVGHNAAFDMRFLQLKEKKSGIRFLNPVLDTLLLSAVVHPNQDLHNLESIARRLNLEVEGRHTALGDAYLTGQILLRLLPLLAEKGIHTVAEAQAASRETFYARVKY